MILYNRLAGQLGVVIASLLICVTCSCEKDPAPGTGSGSQFETIAEKFPIQPGIIDEASGLAPSHSMPGFLWTNQDSGHPNSLYLISQDGKSIKEYNVPGSSNRDWEDVAAGPGPENGVNYLYIGDIGNNNQPIASSSTIYRVPEIPDANSAFSQEKVEKITFTYPDGPRDAETLLLDPATKDIFVISKEATNTGIYKLPFPQSTSETIVAEKVGTIPGVSIATGGTMSRDGSEILIRTYLMVYYWKLGGGESVTQALGRQATRSLLVELEPQGESVCFDLEGKGFYTLSEKSTAASVSLNYYRRR